MKIEKKFKGIQVKIVLYFVTLFFVISLVTGAVQYKINTDIQFQHARDEVTKLASAAALLIDGDSHEKLVNKEDQSSDNYKEIRNKMQEFMKDTEVAGVFTMVEGGDGKTQFIVDADEDPAELGQEYDYFLEMETAFEGTPIADNEMITDQWGTVLSGYAPIKNNKDQTIAIVGVDIDASEILQQKK